MKSELEKDLIKESEMGPIAISRDHQKRVFKDEPRVFVDNSKAVDNSTREIALKPPIGSQKSDRRDFFKTVIPASGQLLTEFLREFKLKTERKSD